VHQSSFEAYFGCENQLKPSDIKNTKLMSQLALQLFYIVAATRNVRQSKW